MVPHMLHSFTGREVDFVYIHGVRIPGCLSGSDWLSWQDEAIPSSSEFSKSYHVSIELSCFVEPLFPLPASLVLSFREDGSSHHDGKLVGHPSLEGVHQDAVEVDSTACLGQSEGSGILVKVTIELVHV